MKLHELDRLRDLVIRSEIKQTDTLEEMVFKAYLKHENLKDTAKEINELNFKDAITEYQYSRLEINSKFNNL